MGIVGRVDRLGALRSVAHAISKAPWRRPSLVRVVVGGKRSSEREPASQPCPCWAFVCLPGIVLLCVRLTFRFLIHKHTQRLRTPSNNRKDAAADGDAAGRHFGADAGGGVGYAGGGRSSSCHGGIRPSRRGRGGAACQQRQWEQRPRGCVATQVGTVCWL